MAVRKFRNKWWVDFRFKFVRYRKKSPLNTREGAIQYEMTLRSRLARGEALDSRSADDTAPTTFSQFSKDWLETYVRVNSKPSDLASKESILRVHLIPVFGEMPLEAIDERAIERFKRTQLDSGLSPKTANNHLNVLSGCLRRAVAWKLLERLPTFKRLRAASRKLDFLSPEESAALLRTHLGSPWNLMALVALRTGLRLGELCALDWTDVDLDQRIVTIQRSWVKGHMGTPKNGKIRHVPLEPNVAEALSSVRATSGLIFATHDAPPTHSAATHHLKVLCREAGIRRIGWHLLRHTFASTLAVRGVPLRVIQELLGHSSITTTERYAHLAPSSLRSAVEVLSANCSESVSPTGNPWATTAPTHGPIQMPRALALEKYANLR